MKHSSHAFRDLDYISQFSSDIRYIPGEKNVPADALSRLPVCSITSPASIDCTTIARNQPALDTLNLTSSKWSWCKLAYFFLLPFSDGTILCDTDTGSPRPELLVNH